MLGRAGLLCVALWVSVGCGHTHRLTGLRRLGINLRGDTCVVVADGSLWCVRGVEGGPAVAARQDVGTVTGLGPRFGECLVAADRREIVCLFRDGPQRVTASGRIVAISDLQHRVCALTEENFLECWERTGDAETISVIGRWSTSAARPWLLLSTGEVVVAGTVEFERWSPAVSVPLSAAPPWRPTDTLEYWGSVRSGGCRLSTDGRVGCWGEDYRAEGPHETWVPGTERVTSLSMSSLLVGRRCVLRDDGTVACWGDPECHVEGDRECVEIESPEATDVPLPARAREVAAGVSHACALLEDESVWCWGSNAWGRLGDGTHADSEVPVRVVGLP